MQDPDPIASLSALAFIEEFTRQVSSHKLVLSIDWWKKTLELISESWVSIHSTHRSLAIAIPGNMSISTLLGLDIRLRGFLVATLMRLGTDQSADVRDSVCGTIGVFCSAKQTNDSDLDLAVETKSKGNFDIDQGVNDVNEQPSPVDQMDIIFKKDCFDLLNALLQDPIGKVRTRAAWALGNLLDSIIPNPSVNSEIDSSLFDFPAVFDSLSKSLAEDKMKTHQLRAIQMILKLYTPTIQQRKKTIANIVKLLEKGAFKSRWNACLALSGFMCFGIDESMVKGLISCISCSNFKVRGTALVAIGSIPNIELYQTEKRSYNEVIELFLNGILGGFTGDGPFMDGFCRSVENLLKHFVELGAFEKENRLKELKANIEKLILEVDVPLKSAFDSLGT